jgi:hypothetical protein
MSKARLVTFPKELRPKRLLRAQLNVGPTVFAKRFVIARAAFEFRVFLLIEEVGSTGLPEGSSLTEKRS